MSNSEYLDGIIAELTRNSEYVNDEELRKAAELLLEAHHIFITGVGRSGFAARAFSCRLMHLGLAVSFVGEPTSPAAHEGDVLLVGSGSGETESVKAVAKKAKNLGLKIIAVTIHPESTIGHLADHIICLPGGTPKSKLADSAPSIQIMADSFEQMSWIIYDVIVHYIQGMLKMSEDDMFARHANLE